MGEDWDIYEKSLRVFGEGMAGVHLICGLGEKEKQMVQAHITGESDGRFHAPVLIFSRKKDRLWRVNPLRPQE